MWVYIREKNLQNPKDKRKIICDQTLHGIFQVKNINMFQMNKALSKHMWPIDAEDGMFFLIYTLRLLEDSQYIFHMFKRWNRIFAFFAWKL